MRTIQEICKEAFDLCGSQPTGAGIRLMRLAAELKSIPSNEAISLAQTVEALAAFLTKDECWDEEEYLQAARNLMRIQAASEVDHGLE